MSKAEKFIQEHTKDCSNELSEINNTVVGKMKVVNGHHPWLTPDQAREAVKIARKETIEWLRKNHEEYQYKAPYNYFDIKQCINDLKQAMTK